MRKYRSAKTAAAALAVLFVLPTEASADRYEMVLEGAVFQIGTEMPCDDEGNILWGDGETYAIDGGWEPAPGSLSILMDVVVTENADYCRVDGSALSYVFHNNALGQTLEYSVDEHVLDLSFDPQNKVAFALHAGGGYSDTLMEMGGTQWLTQANSASPVMPRSGTPYWGQDVHGAALLVFGNHHWGVVYSDESLGSVEYTSPVDLEFTRSAFYREETSLHGSFVSFQRLDDSMVPEPASFLLVGLGLAGLAARRRRRKQA